MNGYRRTNGVLLLILFVFLGYLEMTFKVLPYQESEIYQDKDTKWLEERQKLLKTSSTTKILMFCYMRGGSSLGGQMFNTDTQALLWYEPLAAFYAGYFGTRYATKPHDILYTLDKRRALTNDNEKGLLVDYFTNIFNCKFDELPPQAWLHPFLSNGDNLTPIYECIKETTSRDPLRKKCPSTLNACGDLEESKTRNCPLVIEKAWRILESRRKKDMSVATLSALLQDFLQERDLPKLQEMDILTENILCVDDLRRKNERCMKKGMDVCRKKDLHVTEVLRLKMEDVEAILLDNPDMYLVHYVRDPRGIALSRISTAHLMVESDKRSVWYEADCICRQMRRDLEHRKELENKYPGVVIQVKYEDLVMDPVGTVDNLYKKLGRTMSKTSHWVEYAEQAFANSDNGRQFGTLRENGTETALKWRSALHETELQSIYLSCHDVLYELGYPDS